MLAFLVPIATAGIGWKSPIARRVAASLLYFFWTLFAMCLANSIAWFRNPKFAFSLPDVMHEFVAPVEYIYVPMFGLRSKTGMAEEGSRLDVTIAQIDAGSVIDAILGILSVSTLIFVFSRPYRWLILRRFLVIYGSLALLRAFTVFATQLPDSAAKCRAITPSAKSFDSIDYYSVVERAMDLVIPIEPLTCGDMIFSGHTMMMMLHGLTWHTYYKVVPGTLVINRVKLMVWLLIFTGMVLIVLSRMHYTLDVLLAAYLALTIWNAYHRCADDVIIGHRFHSVWLLDGLLIYPCIQWLEAPHLGEARKGMMQHLTDIQARRHPAALRTSTSRVPYMTTAGHFFAKFRLVVDFRALVEVFHPQTLVANLMQFVSGSLRLDGSPENSDSVPSEKVYRSSEEFMSTPWKNGYPKSLHQAYASGGDNENLDSRSRTYTDMSAYSDESSIYRTLGTEGTLRVRATLGASGADSTPHVLSRNTLKGSFRRVSPNSWWNPTLFFVSQLLQDVNYRTTPKVAQST
eukprot:gb/GECG01012261.1/.p1 GENE.gb/GECG01012261.1/~~gb/GECG01012261.1/.p1  ORF type:complete len:517 (+),score=26.52 gb/GECG01012261.1/:1-1551(+)